MLTFRMAYPPLGIVLFLDIVLLSLLRQLCVYNHYQQVKEFPDKYTIWNQALKAEIRDLVSMLFVPKPLTLVLTAVFVVIFIYDIVMGIGGDSFAFVLSGVLTGWACLLAVVYHYYEAHIKEVAQHRLSALDSLLQKSVELMETGSLLEKVETVNPLNRNKKEWPKKV